METAMRPAPLTAACLFALLAACNGAPANGEPAAQPQDPSAATAAPAAGDDGKPFAVNVFAKFDEPWAMTFLPDGRLLVTEKEGELKLFDPATKKTGEIDGVPEVDYGGQGGFGDVVLHPRFADNGIVYLSYAEAGEGGTRGGVVARAKLTLDADGGGALSDLKVIWRQVPKVSGQGHYSHRIAFSPDGKFMFISSGERQKFDPAQDMNSNLGKIVRLNDDGSVPADNPFAGQGEVAGQVWTLGHRNVLGLAFDAQGRLWDHEMGPKGGDEVNLIVKGDNYGYPIVSNGDHYDGRPIPDHDTRPEFHAPAISWNPVISPAGLVIYSGDLFPDWTGDFLIGGLNSHALVRVEIAGDKGREAARYDMGARIREVEQGPDGAVWLLEDEDNEDGSQGRLLKLTPR
jgi:glucose/arabinose dehydrogenase